MSSKPAVAQASGTFLSLLLYGIYAGLFFICLLRIRPVKSKENIFCAVLVIINFLIVSADAFLEIGRLYSALAQTPDGAYNIPYRSPYQPKETKEGLLLLYLNLCLVDAFLIVRLWMASRRNIYIVIAPFLLLAGSLVTFIGVLCNEFSNKQHEGKAWYYSAAICILLFNFVLTTCICVFMRKEGASANRPQNPRKHLVVLQRLISVLIQSGAMLSFTVALWLLLSASGAKHASMAMSYILSPVVVLVPILILLELNSQVPQSRPSAHSSHSQTTQLQIRRSLRYGADSITVTTEMQTFYHTNVKTKHDPEIPIEEDEAKSEVETSSYVHSIKDVALTGKDPSDRV
ncbi:hypothetical protein FRC03_007153 [Tulasnella sp. 419]|nr:hypothetical protein FRC03_007153 [Tulasnella sp. 419]